ncbi:amidohydrolase family protein [Novosphingobium sp. PS1R-30]|uniref:Amidohydrolase family protein n=1 Tax=Novosphingobium anseongense TaxID=3133436 RepID=A0ABU8S2G7_9SPHN
MPVIELNRRNFVLAAAGSAVLGSRLVQAAASPTPDRITPWAGEKIVDCHFHERASEEAMIAHLDGAGVSSALMLAFGDASTRYAQLRGKHPGRFIGWARGAGFSPPGGSSASDAAPSPFNMASLSTAGASAQAIDELRRLKARGWKGFAESGAVGDVDSPDMHRMFAMAAELDVPIMMHFQKAGLPGRPSQPGRGFSHIEPMLKKYPKAKLVGHASDFWGHIDARYSDGGGYLTDKVQPGGLIDRLLADYPNLYGDLGAPSCLIQMGRDPEFTRGFLQRHQHKLMFGSDCGCADGRGGMGTMAPSVPVPPGSDPQRPAGGVNAGNAAAMQMRMAAMGGLAGKCIARELLSITWNSVDRSTFRNIAWNNAVRVYRLEHR